MWKKKSEIAAEVGEVRLREAEAGWADAVVSAHLEAGSAVVDHREEHVVVVAEEDVNSFCYIINLSPFSRFSIIFQLNLN